MSTDNGQGEALPFQPTAGLSEQRIARVYAEALLNAAEGADAVEDIREELRQVVQELFRAAPQFEEFLASGIISRDNKEKVIRSAFDGKASEMFFHFLLVLARHDRLNILRSILQAYNQLLDQRRRRIPVQVRSAVPLSEDQVSRLRDELRETFGLEPVMHAQVDPAILGGLVVRVGDFVFDRSVRNELNAIQKQLLSRSSSEIPNLRASVGSA
jgi:F-type H+-transporting ATPase subunit delta